MLTVLSRHTQHSAAASEEWFEALFPETCIYTLQQGTAKTGRAPSQAFDPILSELVRKGRIPGTSAAVAAQYQAFAAEWPVLNQTITYQVIQAEAVTELLRFIEQPKGPSGTQLQDRLSSPALQTDLTQLLRLQCNLLDDQTKRASVLIAAAKKSVQAAAVISNQFVSEVSGIHPAAEAAYVAARAVSEQSAPKDSKPKAGEKQQ